MITNSPQGKGRATSALIYGFVFSASWTGLKSLGFGLSDAFLAAAFVFIVVGWANGRRPLIIRAWMLLPFLGAATVFLVDVFLRGAGLEADSIQFVGRMLMTATVTAIVLSSQLAHVGAEAATRLLVAFVLGIALSAVAAVATLNNLVDLSSIVIVTSGERQYGLSSHPNSMAFSLTVAFPAVIYLLVSPILKGFAKFLVLVALGFCVYGVFLADSRAGLIVGLMALALSIFVALARSKRSVLLVPALLLGVVAAYLWLVPLLGETRLASGEGDGSNAGRLLFADQALAAFNSSPVFGAGFDYLAGVAVPLILMSTGGLMFLVAYYWYVLVLVRRAIRLRWQGAYALITLVAIVGFGLLNNGINERSTFIPVFLLLGLGSLASVAPAITTREEQADRAYMHLKPIPPR